MAFATHRGVGLPGSGIRVFGAGMDSSACCDPRGRVEPVTGSWSHTAETYSNLQLPRAARWLGLLASQGGCGASQPAVGQLRTITSASREARLPRVSHARTRSR
jgi:hypothetical protein